MITTTLGTLAAAAPALGRLAAQPLPVKSAYTVAKLLKLAGAEIDLFTERRNALIQELGEEKDGGQGEGRVVQVKPHYVPTFTARLTELAAIEVTLAVDPLDVTALPDTITVSPADLVLLGPLVTDPA
jgi:hypothetical protein